MLIASYGAVAAAAAQTPAAVASAARDVAEIVAELGGLPASDGSDTLAPLVKEIRAGGDPTDRAEEASRALEESRAALAAAALAAVPAWCDSAETLIGLVLPPIATYERLDAARRAAEAERLRRADQLQRSSAQQKDQAARRLSAITGGSEVADETAVADARLHRDHGWQLIYRIAFAADRPTPEEQQRFAKGTPLPLAYEYAVQAADHVADRRVLEADLIARAGEARRALADAETMLREAGENLQPADATAAEAERRGSKSARRCPLACPRA